MLYVKSPDKHALIIISYHIEFLTTLYFGQSQIDFSILFILTTPTFAFVSIPN